MRNRTEIVGVSLWEKLRLMLRGWSGPLRHIGAGLAGLVMAASYIFSGLAPFGVAFSAAAPRQYMLSASAGVVLGHALLTGAPGNMKYIVAVLMVVAARWLFEAKAPDKLRLAVSCTATLFSLGVAGAAVLVLGDTTLYDLILFGAEALLGCGATYFFARAIHALGRDFSAASRADISCVVVAAAVVLMGLSVFELGGVSPGRILAVIAVLICARYGREAGGAVSGLAAGLAMGLAGGDYAYLFTAYGAGGLLSGIFGGMGRVATAASFIFVNTLTALFTMPYLDIYASIIEIFIASVAFVSIPQRVAAKLVPQRAGAEQRDTVTQTALRERMEDISAALMEICTTTQQVSDRLGKLGQSDFSKVYTRTAEQVCMRCGMKSSCWQLRYSETVKAMSLCLAELRKEGSITRQKMPRRFADGCVRADEFAAALNANFQGHVSKEGVQRKVSKVRAVVTDQFEGIALMLDEIADELSTMRMLDPARISRVREYFEKEGVSARQVICYSDRYDRMGVELQVPNYQTARLRTPKLALDLCELLDADFDLPQLTTREKYTSVLFSEKATFTIGLGAYQIAAGSNRICGDAYDFIRNKNGRAHFILSDGMGSGGNAAVDSSMATGLIARLAGVGIGYDAALKMVNSALLIKSGDESLATIDVCSIDLFTGKAEFYKAGAAPTFIVKNGKAGYVESTSLPAGILRGVAFEKSGITLHEGDLVVMLSDGVTVTGADWIKSELEGAQGKDIQRLCEKIATTAKARRTDGRDDDITVLAALVQRGA